LRVLHLAANRTSRYRLGERDGSAPHKQSGQRQDLQLSHEQNLI